jgi:hypothetical protein
MGSGSLSLALLFRPEFVEFLVEVGAEPDPVVALE